MSLITAVAADPPAAGAEIGGAGTPTRLGQWPQTRVSGSSRLPAT
jgi:hypothetical protein